MRSVEHVPQIRVGIGEVWIDHRPDEKQHKRGSAHDVDAANENNHTDELSVLVGHGGFSRSGHRVSQSPALFESVDEENCADEDDDEKHDRRDGV